MGSSDVIPQRSYGCSFACGNPYDYILLEVQGGETLFLCLPCFIRTASDMVAAATNEDMPSDVRLTLAGMIAAGEVAPGPAIKPRGHNAPVTTDDDDLIAAYEDVITPDELPGDFQ